MKKIIPPPCDPKIFAEGQQVFMTHTIRATDIEKWVKKIAKQSGQPVDWICLGGRAYILALGDIEKVKAAIASLMPEHDRLYAKAMKKLKKME